MVTLAYSWPSSGESSPKLRSFTSIALATCSAAAFHSCVSSSASIAHHPSSSCDHASPSSTHGSLLWHRSPPLSSDEISCTTCSSSPNTFYTIGSPYRSPLSPCIPSPYQSTDRPSTTSQWQVVDRRASPTSSSSSNFRTGTVILHLLHCNLSLLSFVHPFISCNWMPHRFGQLKPPVSSRLSTFQRRHS